MISPIIVAAIIAAIVGISTSIATNVSNANSVADTNAANLQATQETNQSNLQIARESNAANAEQANLAYQRSRPINQIFDMMQAGISKPAALAKIAGGGTYTPAQMVGATMQSPHFEGFQAANIAPELSSMIRSIGDIPANAMQQESIQTNLEKTRQELEFARAEEIRRQQAHDLEMDEKLYSKFERESMDNFMSKIEIASQSKNVQPKENQSLHEYIRELGLQDDPDYQKLPASARQRAFEHYKQAQDEKRQQREEQRRQTAAADAHEISQVTRDKLKAELADFNSAKDSRDKQYRLSAINSTLEQIARSRDLILDKESIKKVFDFDKDGNVIYENGMPKFKKGESTFGIQGGVEGYTKFRTFWNDVSEIIPINVLGQVLRFILAK